MGTVTMVISETSPGEMVIIDPIGAERDSAARLSAQDIIRDIEHAEAAKPLDLHRRIAAGRLFPPGRQ